MAESQTQTDDDRTPQGDDWRATRKRVLERDDHKCRFCGVSNQAHKEEHDRGLSAHHIIPKDDGGRDDVDNLLTVCQSCHRTLESTHGKAMAQLKRHHEEVQAKGGVTFAVKKSWEKINSLDDDLAEFSDGHPTFRREFGVHDENGDDSPPSIESHQLREMENDVSSEWAFLVNYGYKQGLLEAIGYIEGWAPELIDYEALAESDFPGPEAHD